MRVPTRGEEPESGTKGKTAEAEAIRHRCGWARTEQVRDCHNAELHCGVLTGFLYTAARTGGYKSVQRAHVRHQLADFFLPQEISVQPCTEQIRNGGVFQ